MLEVITKSHIMTQIIDRAYIAAGYYIVRAAAIHLLCLVYRDRDWWV
jgi:hypothetical protein